MDNKVHKFTATISCDTVSRSYYFFLGRFFLVSVLTGKQGNEIRKSHSKAMSVRQNKKKHFESKKVNCKSGFDLKRKKNNIFNIVIESMVLH